MPPSRTKKRPAKKTQPRKTTGPSPTRAFNFQVHPDLVQHFENHFAKFLDLIPTQYDIITNSHFFSHCTHILRSIHMEKGIYHKAKKSFITFIKRPGKRQLGPDHDRRKGSKPQGLYVNVSPETQTHFYDLLYSFLKNRKDTANRYYSINYFFFDFLQLIAEHFQEITDRHNTTAIE